MYAWTEKPQQKKTAEQWTTARTLYSSRREVHIYLTMGKITKACKTSEKNRIEGRREEEDGEGKNPKDTPPRLRDVGNYCVYNIYIYICVYPSKLSERIVPVC